MLPEGRDRDRAEKETLLFLFFLLPSFICCSVFHDRVYPLFSRLINGITLTEEHGRGRGDRETLFFLTVRPFVQSCNILSLLIASILYSPPISGITLPEGRGRGRKDGDAASSSLSPCVRCLCAFKIASGWCVYSDISGFIVFPRGPCCPHLPPDTRPLGRRIN